MYVPSPHQLAATLVSGLLLLAPAPDAAKLHAPKHSVAQLVQVLRDVHQDRALRYGERECAQYWVGGPC